MGDSTRKPRLDPCLWIMILSSMNLHPNSPILVIVLFACGHALAFQGPLLCLRPASLASSFSAQLLSRPARLKPSEHVTWQMRRRRSLGILAVLEMPSRYSGVVKRSSGIHSAHCKCTLCVHACVSVHARMRVCLCVRVCVCVCTF